MTTSNALPARIDEASEKPEGVAALDRAFSILFAFRATDAGLSLAELAVRTGLYKSTILRLAASLVQHRMMYRADDGRYYVGPAALQLGASYQRGLRLNDVVGGLLRALRDESGESASFYVMRQNLAVCVHHVDSPHAVRGHVREGDIQTPADSAAARVLAAFGGARGQRYGRIRRDCYDVLASKRESDAASVASPVFGATGPLAGAFALSGPCSRIDDSLSNRMRRPMLEASIDASERLGGDTAMLRAALGAIGSPCERHSSG